MDKNDKKNTKDDDWTSDDQQRFRDALEQAQKNLQATQEVLARALQETGSSDTSSSSGKEDSSQRQRRV